MGEYLKLLGLTKIQEGKNKQQSIVFPKEVRAVISGLGWEKGTEVQIHRHGKGIFIFRNEESRPLINPTESLKSKKETIGKKK